MPATVQHLQESEKMRVRYHMGYPLTTFGNEQAAASLQYGMGVPRPTTFLLEMAIAQLLTNPESLDQVRSLVAMLDKLEQLLQCAATQMAAEKVGEVTLRGAKAGETHTDMLEREYRRWQGRLADALGCPVYPFNTRTRGPGRYMSVRG